ncbi:hypothetical protein [Nonomuraea guangzhouensis]|uniref:Uncharacterized protein n=1 Tax=Nonomuraea guangzhouensis TaxID=1291555 RepID=A0ABW4GKP8_9ACTN|nr:hypothetical protein [Nonomuraea guangzhouensis]
MPALPYTDDLADELASMAGEVPATVSVLGLAAPEPSTVQRRLEDLVLAVAGLRDDTQEQLEVVTHQDRTTAWLPGRLRAVGFHASGSMTVHLDLPAFEDVFDNDPGDAELTGMLRAAADRIGLSSLVPAEDELLFERLWRVKAAGDPRTDPGLCRALGAFRHYVRDLPVYGRASATVELGASGGVASLGVSTRRFADDGGGPVVAEPRVRTPIQAARDVAARVAESFAGMEAWLTPQWFRFGYLSLGRRRPQALLTPFYIASIRVRSDREVSAHVTAVPGCDGRFAPTLTLVPKPRRVA